jgi:hypothetical protein
MGLGFFAGFRLIDCEERGRLFLVSIATEEYCEPLLRVLGSRLLFPQEFIGRAAVASYYVQLVPKKNSNKPMWRFL